MERVPPALRSLVLTDTDRGPWFRARPRAALVVAGVLFVAVLAVRFVVQDPVEAVSLLYVLPVALVALAFGRRAGMSAGLLAVVLLVLWVLVAGVELSVVGWLSRLIPLVLLGWLLGDASDRLEAAESRSVALEAAAQRHRDATEVNDTLVQGMAAARWALQAGRAETALRTLEETLDLGHQLVSELLRDADMGVNGHRPPVRS